MASRIDLAYAKSGAGKTSWFLEVAEYVASKLGKRSRWAIGDGGVETITNTGADYIDIWNYSLWDNPFETSTRACEGFWPADPSTPNSPLLPPKTDIGEKYGLFVFEGMNTMGDYLMGLRKGGLANRMSEGQSLNNDQSFRFVDGSLKVGGNAQTHYGLGQRYMVENIQRSASLPGFVGWTAHERVDDKLKIVGPDVVGGALTSIIGALFGNSIHLVTVKGKEKVKDRGKDIERETLEYRAYTRTHFDPNGQHFMPCYANNRMPKEFAKDMPEYISGASPLEFYAILEEGRKKKSTLRTFDIDLSL